MEAVFISEKKLCIA